MTTKIGNQQGFTVIELVMIIVILGILAIIGIPRFIDFTGNAQREETQNIASNLTSASTKNDLNCKAPRHLGGSGKCVRVKKCSDILATITPAFSLGTAGVAIENTYNLIEDKAVDANGASTVCTLQYLMNGVTYTAEYTIQGSGQ